MRSHFFFTVYGLANLGLVFYGLFILWSPTPLLEGFSTHIYSFPAEAAVATAYLAALFRLLGFFNFILGVVGLVLLRAFSIKRQIWIQRLVVVSTVLAYLGPIVSDNPVGHIDIAEVVEHILFFLLILVGVLIRVNCPK